MTTAFEAAPDGASYKLNTAVLLFALRILGLSQSRFARAIGVDQSTASRMLSGSPTTAAVARKIHQAIPGLTIAEIVDMPGISPGLPAGAAVDTTRAEAGAVPGPHTLTATCTNVGCALALAGWLELHGVDWSRNNGSAVVTIPWDGDPAFAAEVYSEAVARGWTDDDVADREQAAALASLPGAR
jgi:transcriptional regulator with XRE-family HTH domain